jgi:GMP synthase-like glutamine amidotransferase
MSQPRILLVNNAVHRHLFRPDWQWKAHLKGLEIHTVNLPSCDAPCDVSRYSHVILTGSEASILTAKPWFDREATLIRQAVAMGVPILGSCFGHQMLVYALSGPEYVRRANPPEVGWADIEMTGVDPLFGGLTNPWRTFVYHFDEVVDPPEPWTVLGRTRHCRTHLIRYGDDPVWGIQAHPEISSRKAKFFIRATLLMGRKPMKHVLHALRNVPQRNDVADTLVANFLAHGRG